MEQQGFNQQGGNMGIPPQGFPQQGAPMQQGMPIPPQGAPMQQGFPNQGQPIPLNMGQSTQQSMGQQFQQGMNNAEKQIQKGMTNAGKQLNQMSDQFKATATDLNWDYNKEGALGFRLIAYAAVANLMFMCGLTTGLSILFAVVAVVEKDKKLTRIVASMLATVLVLQIGVDLWDLVEVPLSTGLGKLRDVFDTGILYRGIKGMVEMVRFVDKTVNWLYHVALICIGMMNMKKITTGTYKTSKYITKYF